MIKIVLKGPLVSQIGKREIEINASSIFEALSSIDNGRGILIDINNKIRAGYIILVNGKDWRMLESYSLQPNDIIEIIPVNHGG